MIVGTFSFAVAVALIYQLTTYKWINGGMRFFLWCLVAINILAGAINWSLA